MGILIGAKRFHEVMRAHDRREWLHDAPGKIELQGTRALIIGYGHIGEAIGRRLLSFDVEVTGVRSKADPAKGILGPNDWRPVIGEYDWIVVAAPSTSDTRATISRAELAAMKPTAWLLNVARGNLVDTEAVCEALSARKIGGAFLDVTDPEPLPSDHKLWTMPETLITAHLSGRSQNAIFKRASRLFLRNLDRYLRGERMENEVDLQRGY
jgi:phosphoglycerate dehydrogenase-like enzyme